MIKRIHSTLLLCKNIDQTAKFYSQVGFTVEEANNTLRMLFGDYRLTFMNETEATIKDDPDIKKGIGIFFYFEVENVDTFYQMLKSKSILTSSEPRDWPWGKREFAVRDPDGYKLVFFSNIVDGRK